ncbi:MAG: polysaccharide deacetylase family protein [Saprospiraceae bacterium]|nr:polysaccharide deacetylase family protein [Saprospiraceae bacterium]
MKILYLIPLCWVMGSFYLFAQPPSEDYDHAVFAHGGVIRLDTTQRTIYLTFTGGDFNDGKAVVKRTLRRKGVPANFFFTGDFYRLRANRAFIRSLIKAEHYLGPHSDKHLLYASWENRDSLLVNQLEFESDLTENYRVMAEFGITKEQAHFFMPPYEWYNQKISKWTEALGLQLINFTPGTRSNADYTTPDMGKRYWSSEAIFNSILDFEAKERNGLNGFILLLHVGTHPSRVDKMYRLLPDLIDALRARGYRFASLHEVR